MTGDQLISESLLLNGVIYPGQTISTEAKATALLGLNMMLGEWNATGLAVYSVGRVTFTLTANKADYTIGAGGEFAGVQPGPAFPLGNIHLYPKPTGSQTLALWVWVQFTDVTDTTAALSLPPGYLKAILYNLAVDLAPKFGRPLDPTIKMVADQCKASLGATNISEHVAATPPQAA